MNSGPQITRRAFIQTTAAAAIAAPLRAASPVIPPHSPAPMHVLAGAVRGEQKRFPSSNAMILFNPACTLAPIAGWQNSGVRPGKLSAKRFGVEAQVISPAHHIGPHTPPTLILHGKEDTTVPYASVVAFESVMKQAGRPCKLVGYDGADHGFFNNGEGYSKTLAEADCFLVDLGWIKK